MLMVKMVMILSTKYIGEFLCATEPKDDDGRSLTYCLYATKRDDAVDYDVDNHSVKLYQFLCATQPDDPDAHHTDCPVI